ncbi:MAG TPA: DUF177 domain-containing protein [Chitinophagaceae bacterium]|jgi:uncharacterized metal-binding protein YceD (DUF177 family)|nr:DUF177 domain-containing protein [Chitinophagaceae bacterium]
MRPHKQFEIAFVGLKSGEHEFNYDIDDQFFISYAPQDFSESRIHIRLLLDKKHRFFLLKFEITGEVTVNCDRCGDPFVLPVWDEFNLVVRMVEDPAAVEEDEDPNVAYIGLHESLLKVTDWVYEFALLSIPMQRVHPDSDKGESGCNKTALKMLDDMQHRAEEKKNPIWKDLDKFRKN